MEEIKQFYIHRNLFWGDEFELHGRIKTPAQISSILGIVVPHTPGEYSEPFIRLKRDEAQQLMDELWNAGVRPVGAAGSMGQLEAIKYHLEDMRKLALK